jgi:hypothetical protein
MATLCLPRPRKRVLHSRDPGGKPRLLHRQLPRHLVTARLNSNGLVEFGLLLLRANHICIDQLPPTPNHSYPGDDPNVVTPLKALRAQRPMARHTPYYAIYRRFHFPSRVLRRRASPSTPRRLPTGTPRSATQPQEMYLDAYPNRGPPTRPHQHRLIGAGRMPRLTISSTF